jgi:hypothetical protein
VLSGEKVMNPKVVQAIQGMWGFDRRAARFTIPTPQGTKTVEAEEEGDATSLIHTYWFGRHYGLIDPAW